MKKKSSSKKIKLDAKSLDFQDKKEPITPISLADLVQISGGSCVVPAENNKKCNTVIFNIEGHLVDKDNPAIPI